MRTTLEAQAALSLELLNEALNASAVVWVVIVEQPHSSSSDSQQQEGGEAMWLRNSFKGSRRSECAARHPRCLGQMRADVGPCGFHGCGRRTRQHLYAMPSSGASDPRAS